MTYVAIEGVIGVGKTIIVDGAKRDRGLERGGYNFVVGVFWYDAPAWRRPEAVPHRPS